MGVLLVARELGGFLNNGFCLDDWELYPKEGSRVITLSLGIEARNSSWESLFILASSSFYGYCSEAP